MKKAIWFSRHSPTTEQLADALRLGYEITVSEYFTELAGRNLTNDEEVIAVVDELIMHCQSNWPNGSTAVFGVFAAPVQSAIYETSIRFHADGNGLGAQVFASWNINRTPEGGKPTFVHYKWVQVGVM